MGFTDSLHPLSIVDGVRAAALRTPQRTAIVDVDTSLSYAGLMAAAGRTAAGEPHPCGIVQWLGGMIAEGSAGEDSAAASVCNGPGIVALSHREILLRAFDCIVIHAAFDRDGTMAMPLPLTCASALVGATIALWLGSTLHLLRPGNLSGLAHGIAQGRFNTCWLGAAEFQVLAEVREALPIPSNRFLLALCDGALPEGVRQRVVEWLGAVRIAE